MKNVLSKISKAKNLIKNSDLKKAGHNDYSNYDYYTPEQGRLDPPADYQIAARQIPAAPGHETREISRAGRFHPRPGRDPADRGPRHRRWQIRNHRRRTPLARGTNGRTA